MNIIAESKEAIMQAARVVARGGLIVIPTDTVYGLACGLEDLAGEQLFELKQRPLDKPVALLVSSREEAEAFALFDEQASAAAAESWPGKVTFVLPAAPTAELLEGVISETVGLRIPGNQFTLDLLRTIGPLAVTSANLAGAPTPTTVIEIAEQFGDQVDLFIDGGELDGAASKVVSLVEGSTVLRDRREL
jgi:L-threonylcarbamoyladenylate synthase